jgi:hypothetical protein
MDIQYKVRQIMNKLTGKNGTILHSLSWDAIKLYTLMKQDNEASIPFESGLTGKYLEPMFNRVSNLIQDSSDVHFQLSQIFANDSLVRFMTENNIFLISFSVGFIELVGQFSSPSTIKFTINYYLAKGIGFESFVLTNDKPYICTYMCSRIIFPHYEELIRWVLQLPSHNLDLAKDPNWQSFRSLCAVGNCDLAMEFVTKCINSKINLNFGELTPLYWAIVFNMDHRIVKLLLDNAPDNILSQRFPCSSECECGKTLFEVFSISQYSRICDPILDKFSYKQIIRSYLQKSKF